MRVCNGFEIPTLAIQTSPQRGKLRDLENHKATLHLSKRGELGRSPLYKDIQIINNSND